MHRPVRSPALPLPTDAPLPWLGGLSAKDFMRRHWQKKPLFVPGAFPGFSSDPHQHLPIQVQELLDLARSEGDAEDIELPVRFYSKGRLHQGLPPTFTLGGRMASYSLLVQQTNAVSLAADLFLDHFRFLPEARLDDLMVSLANKGGGIGAHVDSYDVFLIQGEGERLWETSKMFDRSLAPGHELKVLNHFEAEWQAVCKPGDLLYLPPGIAHRGTALTHGCTTLSVGFRTASPQQLLEEAMHAKAAALAEDAEARTGLAEAAWADPGLQATTLAGEVPSTMAMALLRQIRSRLPSADDILRGIAIGLSAPHPDVFAPSFEPPRDWRQCLRSPKPKHHLRLAPGVRFLQAGDHWVIQGEALADVIGCAPSALAPLAPLWQALAGRHTLPTTALAALLGQDNALSSAKNAEILEACLGPLFAQGWLLLLKQPTPTISKDSLHFRYAQA